MNSALRFVAASFFFLGAVSPRAFAYSRQGHEAIALLAYNSPDLSPKAKTAIDNILAGESIADAAEWPDAIKPPFGAIWKTKEAHDFIAAHPNHHLWHFVNFPVGLSSYDSTARAYALDTDIVHSIRGCIAVLEGKGNFDGLSKREALRFLVHLVGDVHQPLHTVTGYFDVHDPTHVKLLSANKPLPADAFKDAGGNDLFLTAKQELHATWDDELVERILGNKNASALAAVLAKSVSATNYTSAGNYHDWAAAWASDSMTVAADAYRGITFGDYTVETDARNKTHRKIAITLPPGYKAAEVQAEKLQIIKAGSHLLQLLNAIQWPK